jgi:hypothetical protein
VGAIIYKWISPALRFKKTVEKNSAEIEKIQKHEQNDLRVISEMQELSKAQSHLMVAMINHMIDGNNVSKMKETRDKILELI